MADDVWVVSEDVSQLLPPSASHIDKSLDCYLDAKRASSVISVLAPGHRIVQLEGKGIRLRCLTEITADNPQQCKDVMKHFDLYHMLHSPAISS